MSETNSLSKKLKKKQPENQLLDGLNDAQRQVVTFGAGPLLIIAGAGTGKTTAVTRRIAYLINGGVSADQILALTFTEKAAQEMEERVDVLLPYGYYDLWISTFHAFCERVLKQHALDIGISNEFELLDTIQQKILIKKHLAEFNLDYYKPLGNPTKFISEMVKHFSKLKDEEIYPEEYLAYAQNKSLNADTTEYAASEDADEIKRLQEISNAYHVYQRLLLEQNAMDFGDLINYTLKLFRSRKKILLHYQEKFKFILVDEFQDTNFAQYELVKLLSAPKNNLNVVGDDDQSIYKFRGASVSNILQFKEDFPEAQEVTLNENYRSSQNILDTSYAFIQANNPNRLEVQLNIKKNLNSHAEKPGIIEVLSGQSVADEVDLVIKKILALKKENAGVWNDFAILIRANDQADAFIAKLSGSGIPYTFYANKGLYKKPIILDLISYMRLLLNYHDSALLYRVLNFETFKVPYRELVNISHFARKKTLSLYEAIELAATIPGTTEKSMQHMQKLLGMLQRHAAVSTQKNIAELFITIVKDLEIANRIEADTLENLENRELLEQFFKKIQAFEAENDDKTLRNFIDQLDFEQAAGEEGKLNFDPNQGPESVKIMTIHSSKGLEFNYVFVVSMVHLRFPSTERKDAIEIPAELIKEKVPEGDVHLQEERRLFYVAMTRAKKGMFFSYALDYGGKQTRKPSQFLVDLGLVAKPEKSSKIDRPEPAFVYEHNPELFLPSTFSYTQITDFKNCPLKYKYTHLLHLPLPGSAALSFGQTIHATLEKFMAQYKNKISMAQLDIFDAAAEVSSGVPSFDELKKIFERNWIDEWYENKQQKEQYRERGLSIIRKFYDQFSANPIAPKYLEKSFRLPIGNYFFTGKIDRADLIDGSVQILDYKTGDRRLELNKDGKNQLLIYQWAAQEYLGEKVSSLRYWYLNVAEMSEPFLGSPEDLEALKANILETIEQIREAVRRNNFKELDKKANHDCEFEELD